jgi:membrane associated rhomboid family serine protease
MGEADRLHRNEYNPPKKYRLLLGADSNALIALIALNAVFLILLLSVQVGFFVGSRTETDFYTTIVRWFELPASALTFSTRPWTILTYMFSDSSYAALGGGGVIRFISNMIWLWAFGYILQELAGNSKLIPIYIYGGLAGGLVFILAHYAIPPLAGQRATAGLLGANASVMAVAVATTALAPNYRFFRQIRNGIPIWVLTGIYILIDFAGVAGSGAAYSLSHLAGGLAGFLFVLFLQKGKDGSVWMNKFYYSIMHLFDPKPKKNQNTEEKIFYEQGNRQPYVKTTNITQKKLDEILDKINQQGYHFLTKEEKEFLEKVSKTDEL